MKRKEFEEAMQESKKTFDEITISEQLDQVVKVDETQKNIWLLYSLIANELGIPRRSPLNDIVKATVEHYEKHKKIMSDYQEIMKKTMT